MSTCKSAQHAAALGLLACFALAAPTAWAQAMYRCSNGSSTYVSDRPCTPNGNTKLSAFGPAQNNGNNRSGYVPGVGKAPDHLQYLSPACAQLNDAIRTAPARGVGHATQAELREEYQRKCSEDERAAYQQLGQAKAQQRDQARAEQAAQRQEKDRELTSREQCSEMLRILHERRKRVDTMTDGERGDFQRFEANYTARCKSG